MVLALVERVHAYVGYAADVAERKQRTRQKQGEQVAVLILIVLKHVRESRRGEQSHKGLTEQILNILKKIELVIYM
jgi:hypothetical protein